MPRNTASTVKPRPHLDWTLWVGMFFLSVPFLFNLFARIEGHFFAAAPLMVDPHFEHCVLYMFNHSIDGAVAVVVNQPYPVSKMEHIPAYLKNKNIPLYWGGPVEDISRVYVMEVLPDHNPEVRSWNDRVAENPEIIGEIVAHPHQYRIIIGYAGWGPLQFERERFSGAWLITDKSREIVAGLPAHNSLDIWKLVLKLAKNRATVIPPFRGA